MGSNNKQSVPNGVLEKGIDGFIMRYVIQNMAQDRCLTNRRDSQTAIRWYPKQEMRYVLSLGHEMVSEQETEP